MGLAVGGEVFIARIALGSHRRHGGLGRGENCGLLQSRCSRGASCILDPTTLSRSLDWAMLSSAPDPAGNFDLKGIKEFFFTFYFPHLLLLSVN